jgi:hypothetical protein
VAPACRWPSTGVRGPPGISWGARMRYAIRESTYLRGAWVVQAVDLPEGDYPFKAVFSGFEARQRAEAYAAEKNAGLPAPPAKS